MANALVGLVGMFHSLNLHLHCFHDVYYVKLVMLMCLRASMPMHRLLKKEARLLRPQSSLSRHQADVVRLALANELTLALAQRLPSFRRSNVLVSTAIGHGLLGEFFVAERCCGFQVGDFSQQLFDWLLVAKQYFFKILPLRGELMRF